MIDRKPGTQQSIKSFFRNKPSGVENSFAKLEGFDVKPKASVGGQDNEDLPDLNVHSNNQRNVSE